MISSSLGLRALRKDVREYGHINLRSRKPKLREKVMTIALAFDCANGAVLCTDTQMTSDGGFKFEESKLLDAAHDYGWGVWGIYAGNPQLAQSVHSQFYDSLLEAHDEQKPTSQRFETLLQRILNKVCGKGRGHLQMDMGFFR